MQNFAYHTDLSTALEPPVHGGVLVLGNFDGVHRGHQAVIKAAQDQAQRLGNLPLKVVTFEPHSRTVFKPDHPPFRLTPARTKIRLLQALGVDGVCVVDFSIEFSRMKAAEFVDQLIVRAHKARHVVAGFDFVFGYQRGGSMQTLRDLLVPHGIGVTEVTPYRDRRGEVMSSTRTREALQQGDLVTANAILGRPWSIAGVVEPGAQRGRTIGFPTANVPLADYLRPRYGVYAVYAHRVGEGQIYQGVANIGVRPTVSGTGEILEFHLFDFYATMYGQEWEVELISFLRPEQAFPDMTALQQQITLDVEAAKAALAQI